MIIVLLRNKKNIQIDPNFKYSNALISSPICLISVLSLGCQNDEIIEFNLGKLTYFFWDYELYIQVST